jgi:hypothetical protein
MTQITMIKEEDYVVLSKEPESLDDYDGCHVPGSQLIASNKRLIETMGYKTL